MAVFTLDTNRIAQDLHSAVALPSSYVNQQVQRIVRGLGSLPIGDPDAMRRVAAQLRADAHRAADSANHVGSVATGLRWEGHAADRFRHDVDGDVRDIHRSADELSVAADRLEHAAARVEAEQRAIMARLDHLKSQATHELGRIAHELAKSRTGGGGGW